MKFKLDENLGSRWLPLFHAEGHEADTVVAEQLSGASDTAIFKVCQKEQRCLISLDMDFADILRFPPSQTAGVALLRPGRGNSAAVIERLIRNLLESLHVESIAGSLWIVEASRIRVHSPDD